MTVLRNISVRESATLTASKTLIFQESSHPKALLEEEFQEVFQHGVEEGKLAGYNAALKELEGIFCLLQKMIQKVLEEKKRLLDKLKPEVVELSVAISERIIQKELSQPEQLSRMIQTLIHACMDDGASDFVRIALCPQDLKMLHDTSQKIPNLVENLPLIADPTLTTGDCRIEMRSSLLNYSIARELSELQTKLLQR